MQHGTNSFAFVSAVLLKELVGAKSDKVLAAEKPGCGVDFDPPGATKSPHPRAFRYLILVSL
jgi:hypothetical protein